MSLGIFILVMMASIIDFNRAGKDLRPLFSVEVANYDDGGSTMYHGPFYKVFHIKSFNPEGTLPDVMDYGYHLGTWFDTIDNVKARVVDETD